LQCMARSDDQDSPKSPFSVAERQYLQQTKVSELSELARELALCNAAEEQVDESRDLRAKVMCNLCKEAEKGAALECGHCFCISCVQNMVTLRRRKCPACGLPFATQAVRRIYL